MAKTKKNKYFQGYKKLKGKLSNIREFDEFEMDQDEGENYWELELTDGRTLVVDVQGGEGMAGEPMEMVFLKVDGKTVRFKDVEHLIKDKEQAKELSHYLDDVAAGNDASARSFTESVRESTLSVIDPKKPGAMGKAEWKVIKSGEKTPEGWREMSVQGLPSGYKAIYKEITKEK